MFPFFGSRPSGRKLYYNLDLPSFQRDFASLKTLDHGTGPAIDFTRASGATFFDVNGVLQTASNNAPRFDHDPATGDSRGLLIEEARTNLLQRSAEFDDASWTKYNTTITSNNAAAPDGQQTADRVVETTFNGAHPLYRGATVTASVPYTVTAFVKAQERTRVRVGITEPPTDYYVDCNLSTGAIIQTTAGETSAITNVGNGWYRISLTRTVSVTSVNAFVGILNDSGQVSYTGDVTKGLLVWGAQLELGAFPTSYIPTTTAAATRSADSAVVTPISSFYNQAEGTLFAEATTADFAGYRYLAAITAGAALADRSFDMSKSTNNEFELSVNLSNEGQANPKISSWNGSGANKAIAAVANDNVGASLNGSAVSTDTSATIPTNVDRLTIGRRADGGTQLNGHIRKIAYWPKRLSNTLLEQLTT
jgi:hypothetical protein